MRAALGGVNAVAEAEQFLLERIHKLDCALKFNVLKATLDIDRLVHRSLPLIQRANIGNQPLWLAEHFLFLFAGELVFVIDGDAGI